MLSQQTSLISDDPYLQEGDWIQLEFESLFLFSQGFKSAEVNMKANNESPLLSLFIIQHAHHSNKGNKKSIHFNEPIVLIHRLSSKYLSYTPNFANKSEFKLRSVPTDHCQFILKPLYKCQTIRSNLVRNRQECTLSPAVSQYATENINLVVGKFQKNTLGKVPIFLKKNEFSALRIIRKNLENKTEKDISNLLIYQIGHFQEKKWLCFSRNIETNAFQINFTSNLTGYGTLLMIQMYYDNSEEQLRIKSGEYVAFKFIGAKKYIGFSPNGEIHLSETKTESTNFQIELYCKDKAFDINSLIKIQHVKTGKYLSLQNKKAVIQDFTTFNIFELNHLSPQDLKSNLFINQVYNGLYEEFSDISNAKRKRAMTSILKEIIKFIYKNKNIYEQFLALQPIKPHLTQDQQSLFAQIGFIALLKDISIYCFEEFQLSILSQVQDRKNKQFENVNSEYNEEEHIYLQVCIILAGICKNNRESIINFSDHIKIYFDHAGKIKASIQLLYHIFAFSNHGLQVLQSLEYSLKKSQIKAIELFCQFLLKKQFSLDTRIKLIKFFHGSIINENNEKIYAHEQTMLSIVHENRLKNIMFTLSNNQDYDLIISLKDEKEELSEMIDREDKYELELELLYEQIDLLTTLCSRASKKHVYLFRDIISEEMVKKYLKVKLIPKFKSLFLKILVNIYLNKDLNVNPRALIVITNPKKKGFDQSAPFRKLSNLSALSGRLLSSKVQVEMQEIGGDSKFKFISNVTSLTEIKELVKAIIHKKLSKNQIESELIYCLYAFQNFLEVGVCQEKQGQEILKEIANQLSRHFAQKKDFDKDLVQKFLGLLEYSVREKIKIKINCLFLKIRDSYREGQQKIKYSKKIVAICNEFMQKELANLINPQFFNLLYNIIIYSASNDAYCVFLKSSKLYHKLDKITFYFLEMVKDAILIESDSSHEILKKINKIYNALTDYTIDYIYYHENTMEIETLRKTITQILAEAVDLLESHEEDQPINIISQKIMGEFNFFDIIIQLIYQRENDLQYPESNELFQVLFKFIKLFLLNSDENFFKNANSLQKLRVVYKHSDKGQIKLLWDLTCIKVVTNRMNKFVFDCWVQAAKSATHPKIHIPLGLLKLLLSKDIQANQEENTNNFTQYILAENSILEYFIKIDSTQQTILINRDLNSRQQWLFYLTLVMKLLLVVLQQSKQSKTNLITSYRRFFPLKVLVRMIEESFALQFQSEDGQKNALLIIALKLLKIELINMFSALYLNSENSELQYFIYIAQRMAIRLSLKNSQILSDDYIYKNFMFYNKHTQPSQKLELRQAIMSFVKFESPSHFEITPEAFHIYVNNIYLFINVYYSFLFKICEKMIEDNLNLQENSNLTASVSIKQVQIFIQNVFKRYKEFIHEKLSYSEYVAYWSVYSTSIKTTEQILKKKVGLAFNYQANDEEVISLMEGQQYFCNREVEYIFKSFLQNKTKLEKYMYESVLIMTYNRYIGQLSSPQSYTFNGHMKDIFELLLARMMNSEGNFRQKCQILYCYISLNTELPEWQPSLEKEQILKAVASTTLDMNSSNLKYYIFTQSKLLSNYFQFEQNRYKRYKKVQFNTSEEFLIHFNRLKNKLKYFIQVQIRLHDEKMLIDQSIAYFQSKSLNFQIFPRHLSIELILNWLLSKIKYNIQNIDRYEELIREIITLLKTYTRFIHQYDKKYVSSELYKKVQLCLKILFRSITGNNVKMLMVLIQQEIWIQINLLLSLNDNLQQNLEEIDLKAYDLIKQSTRIKLESLPTTYLQGVLQLYNNSMAIYGEHGEILEPQQYPLIPIKCFFHEIKYLVALIIKEFKYLPNNIAAQFYSKIDSKYIDQNISSSYQKFNALYGTYTIATVYSSLKYENKKEKRIAQSIAIANGVEFTAIRMHMDSLNGRYETITKFSQHRIQINRHEKLQSFLNTLQFFFIDLMLLIFGICYNFSKKMKRKSDYTEAVFFFLTKLSRVEIMFQDQIYEQDFMIYPQCTTTTKMKKNFLTKLNFISNQLKRQSILLAIQRFILNYQNQLKFFSNFRSFKLMLFMAKYIQVLKILSYLIVIANNILLLVNSINVSSNILKLTEPFEILTLINFIDSILILLIYIIKDLPLALKIYQYDLTQGIGYFGRKYNEKSQAKKTMILTLMVITNRRLLYNFIYAIVVGLIFYNPIFASVLLLDVLAHVPSLKTLLLAIWRPKYHLFLTMIAYVILQYFFSILMYFLFKDQASPYCSHLGKCFTFIFFTTFKAVHGFVGYLFQQNQINNIDLHISVFQLFEDIYVIIIYQVIIALILAIVIDSFTVARTQKLKQIDYLSNACIVCNIERSKFNIDSKLGFKGHISINHNLYSYIDYKYAAIIKSFDYMSDFQLTALEDKTSSWIPDGKSRQLQQEAPTIINKYIGEI